MREPSLHEIYSDMTYLNNCNIPNFINPYDGLVTHCRHIEINGSTRTYKRYRYSALSKEWVYQGLFKNTHL
jgi:hypothetical protein